MPYFENDNLLSVHIPKNAGKSIEVALGLAEQANLGKVGRRSLINRVFTFAQRASLNLNSQKKLHGTLDVALCAQHLTLQEILLLGLIPKEKVESVKSFAVFRDPFERAVSTFMHFAGNQNSTSKDFEKFCSSWYFDESKDHNIIAHRRQQIDYILDCRGRVGMDRVLLFQNLAQEFYKLCSEWGLLNKRLPYIGLQTNKSLLDNLYNPQARKMIHKYFSDDIEYYRTLVNKR